MSVIRLAVCCVTSALAVFGPKELRAQSDLNDALLGVGSMIILNQNRISRDSARVAGLPKNVAARNLVRRQQSSLNSLSFNAGTPDGLIGRNSRAAIRRYQTTLGTAPTGNLTRVESEILLSVDVGEKPDADTGTKTDVSVHALANAYCSGLNLLSNCLPEVNARLAANPRSVPTPRHFALAPKVATVRTSGRPLTAPIRTSGTQPQTLPTSATRSVPNFFRDGRTAALPTRMFAGPTQYPPKGFMGYGIFAFPSGSTTDDFFRHVSLCEAYMAALLSSPSIGNPRAEQFVTVWPVNTDSIADTLNFSARASKLEDCRFAVDAYDRIRAEGAIVAARAAGLKLSGPGPYLLGWLPGDGFGNSDTLILSLNLSQVRSPAQARAMFAEWRTDIMSDPALFERTFSLELLRRKIRRWADIHGEGYLTMIGF